MDYRDTSAAAFKRINFPPHQEHSTHTIAASCRHASEAFSMTAPVRLRKVKAIQNKISFFKMRNPFIKLYFIQFFIILYQQYLLMGVLNVLITFLCNKFSLFIFQIRFDKFPFSST
jgi:hypothetical protein